MNTERQQREAAAAFAERWQGKGYEKGESQRFWLDLLGNVFGIRKPTEFVEFEDKVQLDSTSFIDVMIPSTHVMIEQKSLGKDLRKPIRQSDGTMLTPFQQAQRYMLGLPRSQHPKWIVTCNFSEFDVYDMEKPHAEPQRILLKDLGQDYYRLQFLVDTGNEHIKKEMEVSMRAGEIVGRIYDAFIKEYDKTDPKSLRYLNILCVRLVFCLYAEDAGIFGRRDMFHDYLAKYDTESMRDALLRFFDTLNTPPEKRSKYMRKDLAAFPYTNGGLFAEEIDIPPFTDEIRSVLLLHASMDFDWSEISPTIFGGVFESTLNPETRRKGGMHYTSIENIHKVIDPLFMNDLNREFEEILEETVAKVRLKKLHDFQDKFASLIFLDPACGSGNFLTETYLSLRRLENKVIKEIYSIEPLDAFTNPIKVSIDQFYGIEINDFAVTVATTALWISESQMMAETERIVHHDIDFLPLKSYANIREGNALRMQWDVVNVAESVSSIHATDTYLILEPEADAASEPMRDYGSINLTTTRIHQGPKRSEPKHVRYDYIIGNPPFVGHQMRSKSQVEDMDIVFKGFGNYGKLDYVAAWYKKAVDLIRGTMTKCAFVSTNSLCQGESVATLWKPLFAMGVHIDFAYQTFKWSSEASEQAAVHCVIVGFSMVETSRKPLLFVNGSTPKSVDNINGYLVGAPNVFIDGRGRNKTPDMPKITKGSQPTDGGHLLLTEGERDLLEKAYPESVKLIRPFLGAEEFINNKHRYCLWLKDVSPAIYRHIPPIIERLKMVAEMRRKSPTASVRESACTPSLFTQIRQPSTDYIVVPRVSSENRQYIPIGFLPENVICSDANYMLASDSLFIFGVLESIVHMAWMRVVCGRLKSDYRYSPAVYNNFPWPEALCNSQSSTPNPQLEKIAKTAQAILDVRAKYKDASLADLYDSTAMPYDLLEAHRANDRAVMAAYGFPAKLTEAECVARLFRMYAELSN